jgi:hypothetical protein
MSVKYDLFPAYITFLPAEDETTAQNMTSGPPNPKGARHLDRARVIVYQNKVLVAIDGDRGPQIVFRDTYEATDFFRSKSREEDSYLTTTSGKKIAFRRNDSCACGSRLRSWNPYKSLNSTGDPTE